MRVWWSGGVSVVATLAVAAAGGCTTKMLEPDLDVWAGIGIQMMALYDRSDGFWWQDPDVWDSKDDVGVITIAGNQLTAAGGICGRPDWGDCGATFAPPVVEVSVPDGPNAPSIVYRLERVAGALEVRDAADAVLISLQPTAGGADIYDGEGLLRDVAHWVGGKEWEADAGAYGLVLRYYVGYSVRETATVLQCPEGTVKTLTHRAIGLLRASGIVAEEALDA